MEKTGQDLSYKNYRQPSEGPEAILFPRVYLVKSDEELLFNFALQFKMNDPEQSVSLCHKFQHILIEDFPPEVFLQRPSILYRLLEIIRSPLDGYTTFRHPLEKRVSINPRPIPQSTRFLGIQQAQRAAIEALNKFVVALKESWMLRVRGDCVVQTESQQETSDSIETCEVRPFSTLAYPRTMAVKDIPSHIGSESVVLPQAQIQARKLELDAWGLETIPLSPALFARITFCDLCRCALRRPETVLEGVSLLRELILLIDAHLLVEDLVTTNSIDRGGVRINSSEDERALEDHPQWVVDAWQMCLDALAASLLTHGDYLWQASITWDQREHEKVQSQNLREKATLSKEELYIIDGVALSQLLIFVVDFFLAVPTDLCQPISSTSATIRQVDHVLQNQTCSTKIIIPFEISSILDRILLEEGFRQARPSTHASLIDKMEFMQSKSAISFRRARKVIDSLLKAKKMVQEWEQDRLVDSSAIITTISVSLASLVYITDLSIVNAAIQGCLNQVQTLHSDLKIKDEDIPTHVLSLILQLLAHPEYRVRQAAIERLLSTASVQEKHGAANSNDKTDFSAFELVFTPIHAQDLILHPDVIYHLFMYSIRDSNEVVRDSVARFIVNLSLYGNRKQLQCLSHIGVLLESLSESQINGSHTSTVVQFSQCGEQQEFEENGSFIQEINSDTLITLVQDVLSNNERMFSLCRMLFSRKAARRKGAVSALFYMCSSLDSKDPCGDMKLSLVSCTNDDPIQSCLELASAELQNPIYLHNRGVIRHRTAAEIQDILALVDRETLAEDLRAAAWEQLSNILDFSQIPVSMPFLRQLVKTTTDYIRLHPNACASTLSPCFSLLRSACQWDICVLISPQILLLLVHIILSRPEPRIRMHIAAIIARYVFDLYSKTRSASYRTPEFVESEQIHYEKDKIQGVPPPALAPSNLFDSFLLEPFGFRPCTLTSAHDLRWTTNQDQSSPESMNQFEVVYSDPNIVNYLSSVQCHQFNESQNSMFTVNKDSECNIRTSHFELDDNCRFALFGLWDPQTAASDIIYRLKQSSSHSTFIKICDCAISWIRTDNQFALSLGRLDIVNHLDRFFSNPPSSDMDAVVLERLYILLRELANQTAIPEHILPITCAHISPVIHICINHITFSRQDTEYQVDIPTAVSEALNAYTLSQELMQSSSSEVEQLVEWDRSPWLSLAREALELIHALLICASKIAAKAQILPIKVVETERELNDKINCSDSTTCTLNCVQKFLLDDFAGKPNRNKPSLDFPLMSLLIRHLIPVECSIPRHIRLVALKIVKEIHNANENSSSYICSDQNQQASRETCVNTVRNCAVEKKDKLIKIMVGIACRNRIADAFADKKAVRVAVEFLAAICPSTWILTIQSWLVHGSLSWINRLLMDRESQIRSSAFHVLAIASHEMQPGDIPGVSLESVLRDSWRIGADPFEASAVRACALLTIESILRREDAGGVAVWRALQELQITQRCILWVESDICNTHPSFASALIRLVSALVDSTMILDNTTIEETKNGWSQLNEALFRVHSIHKAFSLESWENAFFKNVCPQNHSFNEFTKLNRYIKSPKLEDLLALYEPQFKSNRTASRNQRTIKRPSLSVPTLFILSNEIFNGPVPKLAAIALDSAWVNHFATHLLLYWSGLLTIMTQAISAQSSFMFSLMSTPSVPALITNMWIWANGSTHTLCRIPKNTLLHSKELFLESCALFLGSSLVSSCLPPVLFVSIMEGRASNVLEESEGAMMQLFLLSASNQLSDQWREEVRGSCAYLIASFAQHCGKNVFKGGNYTDQVQILMKQSTNFFQYMNTKRVHPLILDSSTNSEDEKRVQTSLQSIRNWSFRIRLEISASGLKNLMATCPAAQSWAIRAGFLSFLLSNIEDLQALLMLSKVRRNASRSGTEVTQASAAQKKLQYRTDDIDHKESSTFKLQRGLSRTVERKSKIGVRDKPISKKLTNQSKHRVKNQAQKELVSDKDKVHDESSSKDNELNGEHERVLNEKVTAKKQCDRKKEDQANTNVIDQLALSIGILEGLLVDNDKTKEEAIELGICELLVRIWSLATSNTKIRNSYFSLLATFVVLNSQAQSKMASTLNIVRPEHVIVMRLVQYVDTITANIVKSTCTKINEDSMQEHSLRKALGVLQILVLDPQCRTIMLRKNFIEHCMGHISHYLQNGKVELVEDCLDMLVNAARSEEGRQIIFKFTGLTELVQDVYQLNRFYINQSVCVLLRNLAFGKQGKAVILNEAFFLFVLMESIQQKEAKLRMYASAALWALLYDHQKAVVILRQPRYCSRLVEAIEEELQAMQKAGMEIDTSIKNELNLIHQNRLSFNVETRDSMWVSREGTSFIEADQDVSPRILNHLTVCLRLLGVLSP